jgi:hypothetical protein
MISEKPGIMLALYWHSILCLRRIAFDYVTSSGDSDGFQIKTLPRRLTGILPGGSFSLDGHQGFNLEAAQNAASCTRGDILRQNAAGIGCRLRLHSLTR